MELEKEINAILTKWNPIGVPEFIASDEYTDCIPILMRYSSSLEAMEAGVYYVLDKYIGMPIARTEVMNNRILDVCRFEYHDNVAVDNFQDMRKKELIV